MQGTIITLQLDGTRKVTQVIEPHFELIKEAIGGGYVELVPLFNSYEHDGRWVKCVAFGDEEGKLKKFPINKEATVLWDKALRRANHPGLLKPNGQMADVLVGSICIVFGDKEFMAGL
jgi:hypothetical protein